MEMEIDPVVLTAGIALAVFLLALFLSSVVIKFDDFLEQLRYINAQIRRADPGVRTALLRRRRQLWLSLLPFVGD